MGPRYGLMQCLLTPHNALNSIHIAVGILYPHLSLSLCPALLVLFFSGFWPIVLFNQLNMPLTLDSNECYVFVTVEPTKTLVGRAGLSWFITQFKISQNQHLVLKEVTRVPVSKGTLPFCRPEKQEIFIADVAPDQIISGSALDQVELLVRSMEAHTM